VTQLWSRVGVRAVSVGLLVLGVVGGVHLAQARPDDRQQVAFQTDEAELQLLKARENTHAAARAWMREAESDAAAKAAGEARRAAGKARSLEKKAIEKKARESGALVPYDGPIPASCEEYKGNRAIGCALMLEKGFPIAQFPCLEKLWDHESGWNAKAENKGSGAYGIPQALPGRKMASAGDDWRTNPATQIKWGLGYVKGRYDTPCGAWSHFQSNGSY
jgi:hypothetical protein